jgi:hypothetical protein
LSGLELANEGKSGLSSLSAVSVQVYFLRFMILTVIWKPLVTTKKNIFTILIENGLYVSFRN